MKRGWNFWGFFCKFSKWSIKVTGNRKAAVPIIQEPTSKCSKTSASFVLKEEGGSRDLRGDGNLGPCLLLDLLQVTALLPNQPAHEAVVGEDFQTDFLRPTNTHVQAKVR